MKKKGDKPLFSSMKSLYHRRLLSGTRRRHRRLLFFFFMPLQNAALPSHQAAFGGVAFRLKKLKEKNAIAVGREKK